MFSPDLITVPSILLFPRTYESSQLSCIRSAKMNSRIVVLLCWSRVLVHGQWIVHDSDPPTERTMNISCPSTVCLTTSRVKQSPVSRSSESSDGGRSVLLSVSASKRRITRPVGQPRPAKLDFRRITREKRRSTLAASLADLFYNCTPPCFSFQCSYSLEFAERMSIGDAVHSQFHRQVSHRDVVLRDGAARVCRE